MRIVASRLQRIGGDVGGIVGPASRGVTARAGVVLILTADSGASGVGEASPLPGYSPDTLTEAAGALDGIERELGELDLGRPAVTALEDALAPVAGRLARSPSARFAAESALLDLVGKARGVPAHRLLGEAPRRCRRAGLLPLPLDGGAVDAARSLEARGLRTVKAKVGGPLGLEAELAILAAVRRAAPALSLRLDANGAWSVAEARDALRRLAGLAPEYVEEPCAGEALAALGPCAVPWAADESLADESLALRLLAAPGLAAVVLKPALLGGLLRARRLAVAAHGRGLRAIVTHLFDGPVALAAACELALSLPADVHGLDPHLALAAFPAWPVRQLASPALVEPLDESGLGVDASAVALEAP